jgi:hypothetical protein
MSVICTTTRISLATLGVLALSVSASAATLNGGYVQGSGSQLLATNGGAGDVVFNDAAALGGNDTNQSTGASFDSVLFDGSGQWSVGEIVSITGIALPIQGNGSQSGTFTFDIRQGAGGGGASGTTGLASLGTATATYTASSGASVQYVNFDTPVTFTADANSTSIVLNWTSTNVFRYKKHGGSGGTRLPQINFGNGNFVGGDDTIAVSIAGSVVPEPSSLALLGLGALACIRRRRG